MKRHAEWIAISASALLFSCLSVQSAGAAQNCQVHKLFTAFWLRTDDVFSGTEITRQILTDCAHDRYNARMSSLDMKCLS
jgi:hypothetical protein